MAGPRPLVSPPAVVPRQYGLLSVVQPRYDEPDSHWRNGVTWQDLCGGGGTTFDAFCVTGVGAPVKAENTTLSTRGARPFTVMAEIDCSVPGYPEQEQRDRATAALVRIEEYQVEAAFWTGTVAAGSGGFVLYPHLAANAEVFDSPDSLVAVLLQSAVTSVTGVTLDPVEALARLEGALGDCVMGQGVIHVTVEVADLLAAQYLIEARNGKMLTKLGNLVAVGAGYTGSAPDGTSAAGVHWMYGTGQVFAYRSSAESVGSSYREIVNRDNNSVQAIVERTYVLGFDCCHIGVPVSLGGIISGTYNSATT